MNLRKHKKVRLIDIVDIERAKKGKKYKAGTIYIQVSATKGQTFILDAESEIESHYVALTPKCDVCMEYLYHIICDSMEEWRTKYQTGLNIVPSEFKYMEFEFHEELEAQEYIASVMKGIELERSLIEREISLLKEFKEFHLDKMFPHGADNFVKSKPSEKQISMFETQKDIMTLKRTGGTDICGNMPMEKGKLNMGIAFEGEENEASRVIEQSKGNR